MSLRLSVFSSLATLFLACGGGDGGDADDGGDGANAQCQAAEEHSDLEWIQENIFTRSCSLAMACHQDDANLARGLNLEEGNSEANMVNVPAMGEFADGLDLVEPGQPTDSYLMVILGQYGADDPRLPEDSSGNKVTMPDSATGLPLLCPEKRDAVERWITEM